eukprot:m.200513 g.200513  ORF g.200513 m.200513 type:complete len:159 (-) comp21070_c0_seq1:157-633(-)
MASSETIVPLAVKYPQLPRMGWFVLSGGIGDAIMFVMARAIEPALVDVSTHLSLDVDTMVWLVCFTASISWRHILHAFIVFGGRRHHLIEDMLGTYGGYMLGIAFSTALRWAVARTEILTGNVAFFAVLYTTALFNFTVLSRINRSSGDATTDAKKAA